MTDFKTWEIKRKKRQKIMAGVFFLVLAGGWLWPLLGYFLPFCMILGLGIAIFKGRKWCDWLCPRGSFYDFAIKPISAQTKIPRCFKNQRVRIAVLALLFLIMISNIISRWPDPYLVGKFFIIMLSLTTLIGVILAIFFHQRTWCFICPVGTFSGWIGKKRAPLKISVRLCNECLLCAKSCPMQLYPAKDKDKNKGVFQDSDCLKCGLCIYACPKRALSRN